MRLCNFLNLSSDKNGTWMKSVKIFWELSKLVDRAVRTSKLQISCLPNYLDLTWVKPCWFLWTTLRGVCICWNVENVIYNVLIRSFYSSSSNYHTNLINKNCSEKAHLSRCVFLSWSEILFSYSIHEVNQSHFS